MKILFSVIWLISCVYGSNDYLRIGNPDNTAIIERPCPVYDLNCIRKFFSSHAHCREEFGPAPDPLVRPLHSIYFPRTNMTVTVPFDVDKGLNGYIEEFYINKDTNNVVLAVEFRNLNASSSKAYFQFHRRAKEPVVTTAPVFVVFESIVTTAVIPNIDDMKLNEAEFTTFSNDNNPVTFVGPSGLESDDPQVQVAVAEFLADLPINIQEMFLTDSAFYISTFIQYNICDFGLYVI